MCLQCEEPYRWQCDCGVRPSPRDLWCPRCGRPHPRLYLNRKEEDECPAPSKSSSSQPS